MKLRHIAPVLGLAALLTVGCAQSTLAGDRGADVAAVETTEAAECAAKAECSEAAKAECSEAAKAECAEKKKECPVSGDSDS